ncbi:MAG: carbohydrate kinase [Treponema sp.]|nr:carbohydrate kinase [Treponema sp.]
MFPGQLGVDFSEVKTFNPMAGGACANVAVCAARLGIESKFIGKVGNDYFGKYLADTLKKNRVNIAGLCYDNERRTTMNFHAKPAPNIIQYLFYRNPGADTNLKWEDINEQDLLRSAVIHFDSLCFTDDPTRSTMFRIIEKAREHNILLSFDVNYRNVLWAGERQAVEVINKILPLVDIVKMNETEFSMICPGLTMDEGAEKLLATGPKIVIITLGEKGSYLINRKNKVNIPVLDVPVVDPIGCGDAYIGAFLTKLLTQSIKPETLSNDELFLCGLYADTAASLTATKPGTIGALPEYEQVEKEFAKRLEKM